MSSLLRRIRAGPTSEPDNSRSAESGLEPEESTDMHSQEEMEIIRRSRFLSQRDSLVPDLPRERQIESAIYLLRGLPRDLTSDERIRLRVALPPQLDSHSQPFAAGSLPSNGPPDTNAETKSALRLPCVRPLAAEITVWLILLLILISRKAAIVAGMLYGYDRRHHVSDRVLLHCAVVFN
jgi:hypothetical protein